MGADSSAHNLAVLEEAVARHGPMRVLYSDNGSVFRTTRYEGSRFYVYSPEVLAGEAPTQLARAVGELGAVLLTHTLGNARAKGKLERWNRFFQGRVLADGPYASVEALDEALQRWVARYNAHHRHRAIGGPPAMRLVGHTPRPLPAGARPLQDICALRETRKVARDHTISRWTGWPTCCRASPTWWPSPSSCACAPARRCGSGTTSGWWRSCPTAERPVGMG